MIKFTNLDLFGIVFSFTTFGNEKFRSIFGACLTVLCIIMTLTISFLFGLDFLLQVNMSGEQSVECISGGTWIP